MYEVKTGKQLFYIGENEAAPLAKIEYKYSSENEITVDHTFVSEALRGQKIGGLLVERIYEFAVAEDLQIIPTCSYAKKLLERNEIWSKVIKK